MELVIAIAALVTAGLGIATQNKRHARVRRRLARLEHRDAELLTLLKATASRLSERTNGSPIAFRSQFGEDLLILELLGWPSEGTFVEVGGYDGLTNSVSSALEQLGWTGLLVEPVPALYEQARANRPDARVVHAAVGRKGSSGTATLRHYDDARGYDESSHLESSTDNTGTRRPPKNTPVRTIEVPLTTLTDLLDELFKDIPTDRVDAASIDVEGHELDVLDGFDLDRFQPAVLLVEDHTRAGRSPINDALEPRGYDQVGWLAWNRVMVRRDRDDVRRRAEAVGLRWDPED